MFHSRTVFIVGAGASHEFGLPVGVGLIPKIIDTLKLDGHRYNFADQYIQVGLMNAEAEVDQYSALNRETMKQYFDLANRLDRALPEFPSIDTFLDSMRDNDRMKLLAKLAIARTILLEEKDSSLYATSRSQFLIPDNENYKTSWLRKFWAQLVSGIHPGNVDRIFDNVEFIVFNYDRCIEHFLYLMLTIVLELSSDNAELIMSRLNIIHPYGQVGFLPWQREVPGVEFGEDRPDKLLDVARSLLTFTESEAVGVREEIGETMRLAESLVFLGFGYLPDNMRLLQAATKVQRVLMTTFEMHPSNRYAAMQNVARMIGRKPQVDYQQALQPNEFQVLYEIDQCKQLWSAYSMRIGEPVA